MQSKKVVGFMAALLVCVPMAGFASMAWSGNRYTVSAGQEKIGNMYVVTDHEVIAGVVRGDVVSVAKQIIITGRVTEDVLTAAEEIQVIGSVNGDVRSLGKNLTISGIIGGDVALIGSHIYVDPGSAIGGDILIVGGDADLGGTVNGRVRVSGGDVRISGLVHGAVDVEGAALMIEATARIDGDVLFRGPQAPLVAPGAIVQGKLVYEKTDFGAHRFGRFAERAGFGAVIVILLMSIVTALLFFLLFRRTAIVFTHSAMSSLWVSAGRGITAFLIVAILSVVACMSVVGLPAGLFGFLILGATSVLGSALSGIIFGAWFKRVILQKQDFQPTIGTVVWGTLGLRVIAFVPVIGWAIALLFFLIAFGVLSHIAYERFWAHR